MSYFYAMPWNQDLTYRCRPIVYTHACQILEFHQIIRKRSSHRIILFRYLADNNHATFVTSIDNHPIKITFTLNIPINSNRIFYRILKPIVILCAAFNCVHNLIETISFWTKLRHKIHFNWIQTQLYLATLVIPFNHTYFSSSLYEKLFPWTNSCIRRSRIQTRTCILQTQNCNCINSIFQISKIFCYWLF